MRLDTSRALRFLSTPVVTEARGFDRLVALRAEAAAMSAFIGTLTESEWAAPSKAPGWRVQDVIAHLGAGCHGFFQPSWIAAWLAPTVQSVFVLNTTSGRTDGGAMVSPTASHRIENVRTAALCSLLGDAWSLEVATPMFELQDLER
jgi:hypothetical protein